MIIMPKGIAVITWDDHFGAMLDSIYPKDLEITNDLVLQLYTSQTMGDISTPRFSIFQTKEIKVASYFGGDRKNALLVFILGEDEEPEKYQLIVIQTFNEYVTNNTETDEFLERAFKKVLGMGELLGSASVLENRVIQNFFSNVVTGDVLKFLPTKDYELGIYYPLLSKYLGVEPTQTSLFIDYLCRQDFLIPEVVDCALVCPHCGSIKLFNLLLCPKCNSKKMQKGLTAQHRLCGYVNFYENFFDKPRNRLHCDNCNTFISNEKDLINKGISYYCVECKVFTKRGRDYLECGNCSKLIKREELVFKEIYAYTANLEKINQIVKFKER